MRYLLLTGLSLFLLNDCVGQVNTDTAMKRNIQMKEVIIKPKAYNYSKDSAENRAIYHKAFRTVNEHPTVGFANGLAVTGLFSELAYRVSGKKKHAKTLLQNITANQNDHFIDSRYTPELTSRLTGLSGDTLAFFMNAYPMPFDYARAASELEFKMWIRDNYRDWVAKGRPMPASITVK